MRKNRRRRLVALATVTACLGVMASPAAATTSTGTITGGSVTIAVTGGGPTEVLPLGGTTGAGCGSAVTAVETSTGGSTGDGTFEVTAFSNIGRFSLTGGTTTHFVEIMTGTASTPSSISPSTTTTPGHIASGGTLTVVTDIYVPADTSSTATDCATAGTRRCRLTSTFPLHSSWTTSTPMAASHIATVGSPTPAGIVVTQPCAAPWTAYNGGTSAINAATFHVASVT